MSSPLRVHLPHRRAATTRFVTVAVVLAMVAANLSGSVPTSPRNGTPTDVVPASMAVCGPETDPTSQTVTAGLGGSAGTASGTTANISGSLPDHQEVISPAETKPRTIGYDGAKLVFKPGAVRLPTGIGITRLTPAELRKLDSGMTNVTGRSRSGFRFTPHPMTFASAVEVTLPYDPALIPADFTAQDIYSYFYHDVALCWQVLQRVSVDEVNHTVTSLTDHFTDMINATVTAPEHPEGTQFDPNQIAGIKAADPAAGVNVIAPPQANSQGDNRLSYPIEVPPARPVTRP